MDDEIVFETPPIDSERRLCVGETDLLARLRSTRNLPVGFEINGRFHAGVELRLRYLDPDMDLIETHQPSERHQPVIVVDYPDSVYATHEVGLKPLRK